MDLQRYRTPMWSTGIILVIRTSKTTTAEERASQRTSASPEHLWTLWGLPDARLAATLRIALTARQHAIATALAAKVIARAATANAADALTVSAVLMQAALRAVVQTVQRAPNATAAGKKDASAAPIALTAVNARSARP